MAKGNVEHMQEFFSQTLAPWHKKKLIRQRNRGRRVRREEWISEEVVKWAHKKPQNCSSCLPSPWPNSAYSNQLSVSSEANKACQQYLKLQGLVVACQQYLELQGLVLPANSTSNCRDWCWPANSTWNCRDWCWPANSTWNCRDWCWPANSTWNCRDWCWPANSTWNCRDWCWPANSTWNCRDWSWPANSNWNCRDWSGPANSMYLELQGLVVVEDDHLLVLSVDPEDVLLKCLG